MALVDELAKDLKAISGEFGKENIVILVPKSFEAYKTDNNNSLKFRFCTERSVEYLVKGYSLHYKRELTLQELKELVT